MDRHLVMTRLCLNNWHYINKKILNFNDDVNFFTGHSGSGKSTVIDALQMILYANTTGQGFFNKAAKDDSNRTLLEYLRGMIRIEENNIVKYTRNGNFSSTVVVELQDTETLECQSIGVAFDIDTISNEITKQWIWHAGELLENGYREENKPLSTTDLKTYIERNCTEFFFTKTDKRFRDELYNSYFGGLPADHFIALFKKAIPFKMDMKIEDFVKNYICTEVNIHIDDMKDSVVQYSNLKLKLEDTKNEISLLTGINDQYKKYDDCCNKDLQYNYNLDKLDIKTIEQNMEDSRYKQEAYGKDIDVLQESIEAIGKNIDKLQKERDEVIRFINDSGVGQLEDTIKSLNESIEMLGRSKYQYDTLAHRLMAWLDTNQLKPTTADSIKSFDEYKTDRVEMEHIKTNIAEVKESLGKEQQELYSQIKGLKEKIDKTTAEISKLESGHKDYDHELLEAKTYIAKGLEDHYGSSVKVDILADVLEVKDVTWLNAVEGYMGNNKTTLIVPPNYARKALELYRTLDANKYYRVAVVDTEKVLQNARPAVRNSLAEEVVTASDHVKSYIDFLMGNVIKCNSIDELRANWSGITKDCLLYQGYKLQHINPKNYKDYAYIGQGAIERRLSYARENLKQYKSAKIPLDNQIRDVSSLLNLESFENISDYEQWIGDMKKLQEKEKEKQSNMQKLEELKKTDIAAWKDKQKTLEETLINIRSEKTQAETALSKKEDKLTEQKDNTIIYNEQLIEKQKIFVPDAERDEHFQIFMIKNEGKKMESLKLDLQNKKVENLERKDGEYQDLIEKRNEYQKLYGYRGYSVSSKYNTEYESQFEILSSDKLEGFTKKADAQARLAVEHFKSDFVYKIRAAIIEAKRQKEDLNLILDQLDFGKDKYRFIITKNHGEEGKFYDMFMDEDLDINPNQLDRKMDGQTDLFSMGHEKNYSDLINELLEMFMPPANSDSKTLEIARANMERYSDYRTYLSFDMEQRIGDDKPTLLSKMLSKNSGGEGQNPLYVALLASFAQIYRINLNSKIKRRPTPRLVVLDEAFSKMDGEKVATCIGLIKRLGFQAIISAPNDKIQNYTDNVNKIFLYANQNKTNISIQEFEKGTFQELLEFIGEAEPGEDYDEE